MDRRQALAVATEDELLIQQQEFLSKKKAPAAAVTRVTRVVKPVARTGEAGPGPAAAHPNHAASSTSNVPNVQPQVREVVNMAVSDIMGEVQERPMLAPTPPTVPTVRALTEQPTAAFPVASHRRQSKFALGRRAETAVPSSPAPAAPGLVSLAAMPSNVLGGPIQGPGAPARATGGSSGMPVVATDSESIHQQNLGVVSGMSSLEVVEAVEELSARLPASTLDFLRARGARKTAALASGPAPAARSAAGPPAVHGATPTEAAAVCVGAPALREAGTPVKPAVEATASSPGDARTTTTPASSELTEHSATELITESVASAARKGGMQPAGIPAAAGAQGSASCTGGDPEDPQRLPADPRLHARVRWGLRGEAVGVQPRDEVVTAAHVLMRDQLRKDEGSVPEGHTVTELLILARSSHPPQRITALRVLRALLCAARPTPGDAGSLGTPARPRPIALPPHVTWDAQDAGQPRPTWHQLWNYLVTDLGVASHLRLALDDSQLQVSGAAVGALAALVGPGLEEALLWEALDCCPRMGWPLTRRAPLTRTAPGATWIQPADGQQARQQQGASTGRGAEEEEEKTPEDVASVDPVAGLMQMQVLARLRYLLATTQPGVGITHHMLTVLEAVAAHSEPAAMDVVRCPGLLDQLKALLLLHTQPATEATHTAYSVAGRGQAGAAQDQQPQQPPTDFNPTAGACPVAHQGEQQEEEARMAVQAHAMRVLRVLCTSSTMAAQLVRSAGLIPSVQGHLLVSCTALAERVADSGSAMAAGPNAGLHVQQALVVVEALRLWRACVAHGISLMGFEGMHTVLCPLMTPPTLVAPAYIREGPSNAPTQSGTLGGQAASDMHDGGWSLVHVMRWHVAREVHGLLDAVLSHALAVAAGDRSLGAAMIQPGTAAALASDAVAAWLSPQALRGMAMHMAVLSDMLPPPGGSHADWLQWHADGMHPLLLLPCATAAVSCWSAALHAAGTYWSTIPTSTPVWGPLTLAVDASGLLGSPAPATPVPQPTDRAAPSTLPTITWQQSTQHVAVALLGPDATASGGQGCTALGGAVLRTCMEQLVVAAGGAGLAHAGLVLLPHQVAVAEFMAGLLRLAQALPTSDTATPTSSAAHQRLAELLLPRLSQHVTEGVALHHLGSSTTLKPWQSATLMAWQPKIRLTLRVADLCKPRQGGPRTPLSDAVTPQTMADSAQGLAVPDSLSTSHSPAIAQHANIDLQDAELMRVLAVTDALLAVLVASPPGAELQCLTALRLLTAPAQLQHLLPHALTAIHALHQSSPAMHWSAAGVGFRTMAILLPHPTNGDTAGRPHRSVAPVRSPEDAATPQHGNGVTGNSPGLRAVSAMPYPPPDKVGVASISQVLFDGWSAAWLSMVAAQAMSDADQQPQQRNHGHTNQPAPVPGSAADAAGGSARAVQRFPAPHFDDMGGSRLPAPATWHMSEVLVLPAPQAGRGAGRGPGLRSQREDSWHPVAAALMHACALEACGSRFQQACCKGPGSKLSPALHMAYLYNAMELAQHQHGGTPTDSDAQTSQWMDPCVRWPLAVLTAQYASNPLPHNWCSVQLAERLTQQFGSSSFGDSLYAQHVALMLTPGTAAPVQQAAWTCLAQDQALHLLPPMSLCMAPLASQLRLSPCKDPGFVQAMERSLTTKELDKAQDMGSVTAELAGVTILAYVCDPLGDSDPRNDNAATASSSGVAVPSDNRLGGMGASTAACFPPSGQQAGSPNRASVSAAAPPVVISADVRARAAARAGSMARSVVRALDPAQLEGLLAAAGRCGWGLPELGTALVQACKGEARLMDKLKRVLT